MNTDDFFIEAVIATDEKEYLLDASGKNIVMGFIKTQDEWDGRIEWNIYNSKGDRCFTTQAIIPEISDNEMSARIPLLWAAKYTFYEKHGDLGGLFGFVDGSMSLPA